MGELSGIPQAVLGLRCHSWEPIISPLAHSLTSLRGTPADHHDVRNPGSPSPRRWRHPPESMGDGGTSLGPGSVKGEMVVRF